MHPDLVRSRSTPGEARPRRSGRGSGRPFSRAGATVAEALVALLCFVLVIVLSLRAFARVGAASGALQDRAAWIHATRTARSVLHQELATGIPARDWTAHPPDSVRLRVFRGVATVCSMESDSTLLVSPSLSREPDPTKDSVLALGGDGRWLAAKLVAVGTGDAICPGLDRVPSARWRVEGVGEPPVLLRLFEAGSYHLAGGAFRYRRGDGGRQPLTEAVLGDARLVGDAGYVAIELEDADGGSTWTLFLARAP